MVGAGMRAGHGTLPRNEPVTGGEADDTDGWGARAIGGGKGLGSHPTTKLSLFTHQLRPSDLPPIQA